MFFYILNVEYSSICYVNNPFYYFREGEGDQDEDADVEVARDHDTPWTVMDKKVTGPLAAAAATGSSSFFPLLTVCFSPFSPCRQTQCFPPPMLAAAGIRVTMCSSIHACVCVCVCVCVNAVTRTFAWTPMQEMQRLMNSSTRRQRDHDTQPAQRPQRVIAEADFERVLVSERVACSKFYVAGVCGVQDLLIGHFCAAKFERLWKHARYESKRVRKARAYVWVRDSCNDSCSPCASMPSPRSIRRLPRSAH